MLMSSTISRLPSSSTNPPILCSTQRIRSPCNFTRNTIRRTSRIPPSSVTFGAAISSSDNDRTLTFASPSATTPTTTRSEEGNGCEMESASDVVRRFYGGINGHDLASVEDLIAEDCVYEDLIFPRPFVGRKAILEFFKKFIDSISMDLQFAIDDISVEDSFAVGVTWHLEWKGKPFPFRRLQFLSAPGCEWQKTNNLRSRQRRTCNQAWGDGLGCYSRCCVVAETISTAGKLAMRNRFVPYTIHQNWNTTIEDAALLLKTRPCSYTLLN